MKSRNQVSRGSEAFTLVELLVAIVIVIGLAAAVFSVSTSLRTSATKVADMNNLRGLAAAAMAAGGDNAGRLPALHAPGQGAPYWMISRDKLEEKGVYKEACYAPVGTIYGGAPSYKWWNDYGASTPIHYVYFANDAQVPGDSWHLRGRVVKPTREEYRGAIPYDQITETAVKAFPRTITDDAWYPVLWAGLCREYTGTPKVAAVMRNGEALGVNVMYLDSHAEWVPREKMKERYRQGGLALFW